MSLVRSLSTSHPPRFDARVIDSTPSLLYQSYALRYQVYCVERGFLRAEDYPEQIEMDEFDRYSIHVGAMDESGGLAGTARLVPPMHGQLFPALHHCAMFADEEDRWAESSLVEVSRLSVSRFYMGSIMDSPSAALTASPHDRTTAADRRPRRVDRGDVFLAIVKALYQATRRLGATHWLVATEKSLHRFLSRSGFPFRQVGPEADYFGPVSLYVMDLDEFDQVVASDQFPRLREAGLGADRSFTTPLGEYANSMALGGMRGEVPLFTADRPMGVR